VRSDGLGLAWDRWPKVPLKRVASLRSGDAISADLIDDSGDYPVYGGNGIRGYTSAYNRDGSHVLIGRQGALCGNINYASGKYWASEHAVVVTATGLNDIRWLGNLLSSLNLGQYSQSAAQPGLAVDAIANLSVPVPPPDVQHAIAQYLDAETARIDALIEARTRMLRLVAERLRAHILSDISSGVPTVPLRRVARRVKTGGTPPEFDGGSVAWYTPASFRDNLVLGDPVRAVRSSWLNDGRAVTFGADSTLIVGIGATAGRVAHLASRASGNQQLTCIESAFGVVARFVSWQLWARTDELRGLASTTTLPIISNELLRSLPFACPPGQTQRRLASDWDSAASRTEAIVDLVTRTIDLLVERRQALITAAVTGQLEIPRVAA
jgi:type I restriction enzyme, S subunit